jgi:hypothetical protein
VCPVTTALAALKDPLDRGRGDPVRAMFVIYSAGILFGLVYFSVIGLTHH